MPSSNQGWMYKIVRQQSTSSYERLMWLFNTQNSDVESTTHTHEAPYKSIHTSAVITLHHRHFSFSSAFNPENTKSVTLRPLYRLIAQ